MPKLELSSLPATNVTGYPELFADVVAGRWVRRLAPAAGLTDFGASHVTLKPGAWSAQRHWHEREDELAVMLVGQAMLIDDSGESVMRPGDIAVFPKGDGNGHCLRNASDSDCVFLVIGRPPAGACHYPDIDMHLPAGGTFMRKDGSGFT